MEPAPKTYNYVPSVYKNYGTVQIMTTIYMHDSPMVTQVVLSSERFSANITRIRALVGVGSFVD